MKKKDKEKEVEQTEVHTILDERFYRINGLSYPRITWILEKYPKDEFFYKWLRENGSSSDDIKNAAADAGTRIHHAARRLVMGESLTMEAVANEVEWSKVADFVSWYNSWLPDRIVAAESLTHSVIHGYAGTFDLMVEKNNKKYLLDLKTGKGVYNSYYLQLAAYKKAFEEQAGQHVDGVGIIHVGTKHKSGYNFILVEDEDEMNKHFDLFLAVKKIFHNEYGNVLTPSDKTFPTKLKLNIKK